MIWIHHSTAVRYSTRIVIALASWLAAGLAHADTLRLAPSWADDLAVEAEVEPITLPTLDSLALQYRSQLDAAETGFSLKRYSARLRLGEDVLSVGRDWSGFQDLLDLPIGLESVPDDAGLTHQMRFQRQGLALALEQPEADQAAPQLVLSWRGQTDQTQLGIAVLGRPADETAQSEFGWGVNLAGGLRFGKLFTALGVSVGEQIDALLLGPADQPAPGPTLLVAPKFHYAIGNRGNAWLGLSRYAARENGQTLDTIHVGYQWQVLPGTQLDIEFAGDLFDEDASGQTLTIGAEHRF